MTPATFREVRRYLRVHVRPDAVQQAASQLRMKLLESSHQQLMFAVRFNLWSFGERVTVALGSVDGCSLVDIRSSCILPMQLADFGKNKQNVRRLFDGIDNVLGNECEHVLCLLCGGCGYLLVGIPSSICPECGHAYSANDAPCIARLDTSRDVKVVSLNPTMKTEHVSRNIREITDHAKKNSRSKTVVLVSFVK